MASKLGPYELRGELGRGAMAVVWRAYDPNLDREVALKEPVMPEGIDSATMAELSARFVREGCAAARLNHPNIVTIFGADIYDGRPAIVMELIEGRTLTGLIHERALPLERAVDVIDQLLYAIGYAHTKGIVHRDIKPDNVFLTDDGRVKLGDFGVARIGGTTLTQVGAVLGTPGYMSPEQVVGKPADGRADIFAIGVVAYELSTGRNPFGAADDVDTTTVLYRIVNELPTEPSAIDPSVPSWFADVVARALAKDPAARYQTADDMRADLRARYVAPAAQPPSAPVEPAVEPSAPEPEVPAAPEPEPEPAPEPPPEPEPVPKEPPAASDATMIARPAATMMAGSSPTIMSQPAATVMAGSSPTVMQQPPATAIGGPPAAPMQPPPPSQPAPRKRWPMIVGAIVAVLLVLLGGCVFALYLLGRSTADTTAPIVAVTSPAAGAQVQVGTEVPISVEATDNTQVTSVEVSIDGKPVATLTSPPYVASFKPSKAGSVTVEATAKDAAGNTASSGQLRLSVVDGEKIGNDVLGSAMGFWAHWDAHDLSGTWEHMSSRIKRSVGLEAFAVPFADIERATLQYARTESVDGDTATVRIKLAIMAVGEDQPYAYEGTLAMVREDGHWLVDEVPWPPQ